MTTVRFFFGANLSNKDAREFSYLVTHEDAVSCWKSMTDKDSLTPFRKMAMYMYLPDQVLSVLAMYADDSTLYFVSPNSSNTCHCEMVFSLHNDLL